LRRKKGFKTYNEREEVVEVEDIKKVFKNLSMLVLIDMGLSWKKLREIAPFFGGLKELLVNKNKCNDFENIDEVILEQFKNLELLNLEDNGIIRNTGDSVEKIKEEGKESIEEKTEQIKESETKPQEDSNENVQETEQKQPSKENLNEESTKENLENNSNKENLENSPNKETNQDKPSQKPQPSITILPSQHSLGKISLFPKLSKLYLSNNSISRIPCSNSLQSLSYINIEHNNINSHKIFNDLSKCKKLENLRVLKNPISMNNSTSRHVRNIVVGAIRSLKIVNGTHLNKYDRRDYEIYYLRNAFEEYFKAKNTSKKLYKENEFYEWAKEEWPNAELFVGEYENPYPQESGVEGILTEVNLQKNENAEKQFFR